MNDTTWFESAACKGKGDHEATASLSARKWWFPDDNEMTPEAEEICNGCPVIDQCREYVMSFEVGKSSKTRHGNAAGMSPLDRARLRRVQKDEERLKRKAAV